MGQQAQAAVASARAQHGARAWVAERRAQRRRALGVVAGEIPQPLHPLRCLHLYQLCRASTAHVRERERRDIGPPLVEPGPCLQTNPMRPGGAICKTVLCYRHLYIAPVV